MFLVLLVVDETFFRVNCVSFEWDIGLLRDYVRFEQPLSLVYRIQTTRRLSQLHLSW